MVIEYVLLREIIPKLECNTLDDMGLSYLQKRRLDSMFVNMKYLYSVRKAIKSKEPVASQVRVLFDAVK